MTKINKRFVDSAAPKPGRAETVYFDEKLSGFGLRVKASGAKSFLIQYRNARGESRRLTLGSKLTPDQARREARLKLADVERGRDPAKELDEARAAITVKTLCDDYLQAAEKGLILGKRKRPKKASTLDTDRGRISRHIVPLLGKRVARDVTTADINKFMRDVSSGKTAADEKTKKRGRAIVTGGAGTAARTVGLLGGIFSYAISEGIRSDNPVRGVKRQADNERERRLSLAEYAILGEALAEAEAEKENPLAVAAVKALALTGARRGEIANLKKPEVDRVGKAFRFTDTKEGASVRPLGAAAIRALDAIPKALQRASSKYVFPGGDDKRPYSGLAKAISRIMARKPELADVTAHVLRHSFASLADDLGYSEATTGAMLGHGKKTVTARYIHKPVDAALIDATDKVADMIESAMAGKLKDAEVHNLKTA
ncbi:MAG TPA: integrase arm-type DNA-binding domain-containing protein [Stellaceae bacterium]|nr:integrase arm-type DNA-binding domain-containing protein [Stellaceae bacterium]